MSVGALLLVLGTIVPLAIIAIVEAGRLAGATWIAGADARLIGIACVPLFLVVFVVQISGLWLVTQRDPAQGRWSAVLPITARAGVLLGLLPLILVRLGPRFAATIPSVLWTILLCIGVVATMLWLRQLACRVPDRLLARSCGGIAGAWLSLFVLGSIPITDRPTNEARDLISLSGTLIVLLITLLALCRLRRRLLAILMLPSP